MDYEYKTRCICMNERVLITNLYDCVTESLEIRKEVKNSKLQFMNTEIYS